MCGLALFFTKKKNELYIFSSHTKPPNTDMSSSLAWCTKVKPEIEWDVLLRTGPNSGIRFGIPEDGLWEARGNFGQAFVRFVQFMQKKTMSIIIYIYISLNWKFRWARNTSNVRNASSAHPFIGFSNLICLWANSTTTNRCSSMIAVKPTNDGESAPCQITRRKETSCQGRSTLYILGINSSHL